MPRLMRRSETLRRTWGPNWTTLFLLFRTDVEENIIFVQKFKTMGKNQFIYNSKIIWIYLIAAYLLKIYGYVGEYVTLEYSGTISMAGNILLILTWLVILIDMIKTKLFNKMFWIIFMFVLAPITPLFYMIQRNKLIRLGNSFENR